MSLFASSYVVPAPPPVVDIQMDGGRSQTPCHANAMQNISIAVKRRQRNCGLVIREGPKPSHIRVRAYICQEQQRQGSKETGVPGTIIDLPSSRVIWWNAILSTHSKTGQHEQVILMYDRIFKSSCLQPDGSIFILVLRACAKMGDLDQGRKVHTNIVECGLQDDLYIGSILINMYADCGSLHDAMLVFNRMIRRDTIIWSALIAKHVQQGQFEEAFCIFQQMVLQNVELDKSTCFWALKACSCVAALEHGREIHCRMVENGLLLDAAIGTVLIDMYAKCGSLENAFNVFNALPSKSVVTWTALITGCAEHGRSKQAFDLFQRMEQEGIVPNQVTFVCLLKADCSVLQPEQYKQVHYNALASGFELDLCVASMLIDIYARHRSLDDACRLFNRLPKQDTVTWSVLISAYNQHGHGQAALELFQQMQQECISPNQVTFVSVLKACSSLSDLEQAKSVHNQVVISGFDSELVLSNTLIDTYAKCGSLEHAHGMFGSLTKKDRVSWNVMIAGCIQHGRPVEAFEIFLNMRQSGLEPDISTFVSALQTCSSVEALQQGEHIHLELIASGYDLDLYACNALIAMYAKCCSLEAACILFERLTNRDVVTWNSLIVGYIQYRLGEEAYKLYEQMQQESVQPNNVTFICILQACSSVMVLDKGYKIHSHIICDGLQSDIVISNSLIKMYAACKSLDDALTVFLRVSERNLVSWNVLIAGYVQHGNGYKALQVFWQMHEEGFEPNNSTFISVLHACSDVAALEQGKEIHKQVIESGFESDIQVANTLIDMYVKCGSLNNALEVFDKLKVRNVVTWSTLIRGHAQRSDYCSALRCFEKMQQAGIKPDGVAYLCLLSACSHTGLLEKGCAHFKQLREDCTIVISVEHYNCMVDLFGGARYFSEAEDLLETLPFQDNIVGWTSLLGSCRTHKNVHLGKRCFDHIVTKESSAVGYVLMAKLYARLGRQCDAERVEDMRKQANIWKKPGKACIEIGNQVRVFTVGDTHHPESSLIYEKLESLTSQLKRDDNTTCLDMVINLATEKDKNDALCCHCRKLAVAFGLIFAPQDSTIRVAKNLKMCIDCHNALKIISKVQSQEIVIVNKGSIHQFKEGPCCCKDYCS